MENWLYPTGGTLILLLLATDVFRTAFHAEGRGGPLNRKQNRMIWNIVRWAGTLGGTRRSRILSLAGPIIAIATIATWTVLLLVGFGLIYLPYVLDFHFSPGQPSSAVLEAFYYSGIIAATVGQGDVVAPGTTLRALSIVQAFSGYALITVAVTYVLAVYRELITSQTLASAIDARLKRGTGTGEPGAVLDDDWARSFALRLAHVLEAHFNYPILHYYRPSRTTHALPPQIARLLAGQLEGPGDNGAEGPGSRMPEQDSRHELRAMINRYIGEVHSLFVKQKSEPVEDPEDELRRLEEILAMMAYDTREGTRQ